MRGSLKIASIAGIGLYVHWTFGILIVGLPILYLSTGAGLAAAMEGLVFILAVFACVVMHEYGHALTARRFDVPTRDITLLPIGGLARLQRIPEEPKQEFAIAIMGPMVNVVIAVVLFIIGAALGRVFGPETAFASIQGPFLSRLAWVNVVLVLFNLLPAFPMDGGRILRALLATRMEYVRATEYAANLGKIMAIGFGLLAFMGNFILLFIAIFVYIGAQQEAHYAKIRSLAKGLTVRHAMITHFTTLAPEDTLSRVIDLLREGYEEDFVVVEDNEPVGILTRRHLLRVLPEYGPETRVDKVMQTEFSTIAANEMLIDAFMRMQASESPLLPVVSNGRLAGVLTLENIGELMMIGSALSKAEVRSTQDALFERAEPKRLG